MKRSIVLLVNPNLMQPPVAPLGLQYVADGLRQNGFDAVLCDLTFESDWKAALEQALDAVSPIAIGVSIRNLDDAYYASQDFILEKTTEIIRYLQDITNLPVILGGVGFSAAPLEVLAFTGATYGIAGEGEEAFSLLLKTISQKGYVGDVPGAVFWVEGKPVMTTPPARLTLATLPVSHRDFLDNKRYFREGGQAGIETKRGCKGRCVYCLDPLAKGRVTRVRPPEQVVAELEALLAQGIDVFHLCDSEFNLPQDHAENVCKALISKGMGERISWYAYGVPAFFDESLAELMAQAGCRGINFGADHSDPDILRKLGRGFRSDAITRAVNACRATGMAVMLDLLLGSPGETRERVENVIDFVRNLNPDRIGLSCGVRIYPHTPLAARIRTQGPLERNPHLHGTTHNNGDLLRPIFYIDAALGTGLPGFVTSLIGSDKRFFHTDPIDVMGNYNYNNNSVLAKAIQNGARGAYWDILRHLA